jgi:hypothetical protein
MTHLLSLLVDTKSFPKPAQTGSGAITNILNIVFAVMGAFAFLMVVIGGFRYTISGSNADTVASARRQIVYSIVGLVVIGLAAAIVNFALGQL